MGLGDPGIPPRKELMLQRAPPAVRALCDPWVGAARPFARLRANAAGGHIVGVTHARHELLQGTHILPICNDFRSPFFRGEGLPAVRQDEKLAP